MTDFEARLEHIRERAVRVMAENPGNNPIAELANLIDYLTRILEIHLRTGER